MNTLEQTILLKDDDWSAVDGELCRVLEFTPLVETEREGHVKASISKTPYASVVIECEKTRGNVKGFITHKVDFSMLWAAFNKPLQIRGVRMEISCDPEQGESAREVWFIWTKKRYKRLAGLFKAILPRLIVMVCPKGAYDLATNPNIRPELTGEKRFLAQRPFVTWTPEVMMH